VKLRWKAFEKRLRSRVRVYDTRRQRRFWQKVAHFINSAPDAPLWLARIVASLFFGGLAMFNIDSIRAHPDLSMAGIGLWGLLVAVMRAELLWNSPQLVPEFRTLWILPWPADTIFHRLLQRLAVGPLLLFFEFLLVYGVLATSSNQPAVNWAGAVVCAGLQAALSIALSLLLVPLKINSNWMVLCFFVVLFSFEAALLRPQIEVLFAKVLYLCNPMGWMSAIYLEGWVRGNVRAWWGFVPVLAVSASAPFSLKSVRRLHHDGKFRAALSPRAAWSPSKEEAPEKPAEPPEQRQRIATSEFLQPFGWDQSGLVERLIARILEQHEKVIAEILASTVPRWSKVFFGLMVWFLVYLVANTQIGLESLEDILIALFAFRPVSLLNLAAFAISLFCFAIMLSQGLALFFWFTSPELTLGPRPGAASPYRAFRLFPVNYWDTAKTIAKVNAMIFMLLLPPAVIFSFTPACQMVLRSADVDRTIMLKCLALVWSCSVMLPTLKMTPSIIDGWRHWRSFLRTVLVVAMLCFLGIALFFSPKLMLDIVLGALLIMFTVGWFVYCGAQYRKS